jgi:lipid A 3-O-deacylase
MAKSGRASRVARVFMSLLSCCLLMSMQSRAWGDETGRITILEENDSLYFNSDKHYTQGLRISDLLGEAPSPDGLWDDAFKIVRSVTPVFEPGATRRTGVFLGQSIFTPKNLAIRPPDPHDRPYAGWLYAGASLLQETGSQMLENAELDLGIVGPGALGKQVQNDFHQFIGVPQAKGWSSQLQQEFGIVLSYERLWRLPLVGDNRFGVDIVPQLGASVGNIFTYGKQGCCSGSAGGLAPITDLSESAPHCPERTISTPSVSTKGRATISSPAHKGGSSVATSSSTATRSGQARASRRRT